MFLLITVYELGCVNSPVERIALPGYHRPENLGLLNLQMFESDLHESHLLTPHLQNNDKHQNTKTKYYWWFASWFATFSSSFR